MGALLYFLIASFVAAFGTTFVVKYTMQQVLTVKKDEVGNELARIQTYMFMTVAIVEIVPLILIILGFIQLEKLTDPVNISTPLSIISAIVVICTMILFKQKNKASKEFKKITDELFFIGLALMMAFPIVGFVSCFITP